MRFDIKMSYLATNSVTTLYESSEAIFWNPNSEIMWAPTERLPADQPKMVILLLSLEEIVWPFCRSLNHWCKSTAGKAHLMIPHLHQNDEFHREPISKHSLDHINQNYHNYFYQFWGCQNKPRLGPFSFLRADWTVLASLLNICKKSERTKSIIEINNNNIFHQSNAYLSSTLMFDIKFYMQ